MTPSDVERLHKLFVALTGRDIPLDLQGVRQHQWYDWLHEGFTEEDLRLVIPFLKQGIREGKRNEGCLKFVNLIADPLKFGDDLAQAKTHQKIMERKPKMDHERESVIRATGRPPKIEHKVTPAGEAAFAALKAFREKLEKELADEPKTIPSGDGH